MKRLWELSLRITEFVGVVVCAFMGLYELIKFTQDPTDHKLLIIIAWTVGFILFRGTCAEEEG